MGYGDIVYVPDPGVLINLEGFRRSGLYEVLPGETWADVIRMAGEPSLLNNKSSVVLENFDESGELTQIYYNLNLLDEEDLEQIPLHDRDHLHATIAEINVYVLGEVGEPGTYEYNPLSTPLDYLTLAGGANPDAHLRFVTIIRPPRDPQAPLEESETFTVDIVESITHGSPQSVMMEPGDILFIPDQGETIDLGTILSGLSVMVNAVRLFD